MKPRPICKIAQETGEVPLDCLFACHRKCKEAHEAEQLAERLRALGVTVGEEKSPGLPPGAPLATRQP